MGPSRSREIAAALSWLLLLSPATAQARDASPATGSAPPRFELSLELNPIDLLRAEIAAAETSIDAVVYKFDAKSMRQAVSDALERGLAVRIVADESAAEAKKSDLRRVAREGAQVRLWKRDKLHAKFATLDGRRVVTGSFNWTRSADSGNVELVIRYDDPAVAARFSELFERLWDGAKPFDPK